MEGEIEREQGHTESHAAHGRVLRHFRVVLALLEHREEARCERSKTREDGDNPEDSGFFYRRNLAQRYAEEGEVEVRDAVDNSRADAL